MNKNIKWYVVLTVSVVTLIILTVFLIIGRGQRFGGFSMRTNEPLVNNEIASASKLLIPPLLEDQNSKDGEAEFNLFVQYGSKEFLPGKKTDTLGYNGDYLGPIIKVNKGDKVKINVNNTLDEPTTVHWHGLEVPAEMDGGPHQVINANDMWTPHFTIDQPAATLWYHPHLLDYTGEQVYKGLAGLIYIEDEVSKNLNIPKEHGVNDIPLIIQDKRFTKDGDIPYNLNMSDMMNGLIGDTVIVNGTVNPELDVKNEVVRFRILNGSNARTYDFNFSGGQEFYQIASDGGFLTESVKLNKLSLAPAERAEVLIDLSDYKVGDKVFFRDGKYELMTINIVQEADKSATIPKDLVQITDYDRNEVVKTRSFVMSGMGPMVTINGKQMNMNRIDERVNIGELEEWVITNEASGMGMMGNSTPHPFHVHGVQFQVIERNGKLPPLNEQGWKDTVMVDQGEEVRILVKFSKKGLFMYHCHILEHEDSGMMGQFIVE